MLCPSKLLISPAQKRLGEGRVGKTSDRRERLSGAPGPAHFDDEVVVRGDAAGDARAGPVGVPEGAPVETTTSWLMLTRKTWGDFS